MSNTLPNPLPIPHSVRIARERTERYDAASEPLKLRVLHDRLHHHSNVRSYFVAFTEREHDWQSRIQLYRLRKTREEKLGPVNLRIAGT
jgi:hypothetical protein